VKYGLWLSTLPAVALAYFAYGQYRHSAQLDAKIARLEAARVSAESPAREDRAPSVVTLEREVRVEAAPSGSVALTRAARGRNAPPPPSVADQEAFLATTFSSQPTDGAWSRGASQQISDILRPLAGKNTSVVSVDCRSTLCRADLEHETDADFRAFMQSMFTGPGAGAWKGAGGGGKVETGPDGRVKAVLYFAKEGTALPALT
jgi:hypothetical protein